MKHLKHIGLILLMALVACSKDNKPEHNPCGGSKTTSYITSPDLQNCQYKTGSYWVFIDSVDNTVDSISIESDYHGFIEDPCGNSFEIHSFKIISSTLSEKTDYVVAAGGLFKDFNGSPNSGTQIYDDFNTTVSKTNYVIERFDSLFVYDQYYEKVLRVEIEKDKTEDNSRSVYFINSEFGFLKHDIYSNNILISKKVLMRKDIIT